MVAPGHTTIQVDATTAEVIKRAEALAQAKGETLGTFLSNLLPPAPRPDALRRQAEAWTGFVSFLTEKVRESGAGTVDDSRESMYDDRL